MLVPHVQRIICARSAHRLHAALIPQPWARGGMSGFFDQVCRDYCSKRRCLRTAIFIGLPCRCLLAITILGEYLWKRSNM